MRSFIYLCNIIALYVLAAGISNINSRLRVLEDNVCIRLEQPEFLDEELNDNTLFKALKYYNVEEPSIVLAQAKLESANYKSKLYKEKNNLFGLYNSKSQQYFTFEHWTDCIIAYKNMIQRRRKEGEDYYKFLQRIRYAKDKEYIDKLKEINRNYGEQLYKR